MKSCSLFLERGASSSRLGISIWLAWSSWCPIGWPQSSYVIHNLLMRLNSLHVALCKGGASGVSCMAHAKCFIFDLLLAAFKSLAFFIVMMDSLYLMMANGRQPKELICKACFSGGSLCQTAPAGPCMDEFQCWLRLPWVSWLLLVVGSKVCGCFGLAGSLGVWLHWIGWPLHCTFRMAWRGRLNFPLLPVVGSFKMIG